MTHAKRNFLLIFFIILQFNNPLMAQFFDQNPEVLDRGDFLATYSLLWKEDSLNADFQRQEDMYLLIGANYSQFVSKNFLLGLLQGRRMEKEGKLDEFLNLPSDKRLPARFVYNIFKNYKNGNMVYSGHVMPTRFEYEEGMDVIKWTLGEDTSKALGYRLNQAFTNYGGRNWVAWYSADIPMNDGPYKFCGLPGLILKVYDSKKDYIFEAVTLEKLKEPMDIEKSNKDVVKTTRENYIKAEDNMRYDIINRVKDAGNSNETQQMIAKKMLKRNNPIELK